MQTSGPFRVAALYRFTSLPQWQDLRAPLADLCDARGIKGTLLLANEGINGTVAGTYEAIAELIAYITAIPELSELELKYSEASDMPFLRMKVRLKREIVTMGVDTIDPIRDAGTYVDARDWNALIADPDTIVIDTRNSYETAIGTFKDAVDPDTASFTEFPRWAQSHHNELKGKKVAMFCTGGIRCEKATAYMRSIGIDDVYHLKGGILKYLEEVPAEESLWEGECFVFDERVSVKHGLVEGDSVFCRACRYPLTPEERTSPKYVEGISCHRCYDTRTDADRARFAERQKQIRLAAKRGKGPHIGS
jgi:UPF0176 protein